MSKEQESKIDDVDDLCIRTIRVLASDVVEKANSGHPGAPIGLAPVGHVLWTKFLRTNPKNSKWINRDRFVLSNGHACALQYCLLHLSGFKVTMDNLKRFRQIESNTPGHPEVHITDGVEVSTGPLGQGFAQAVGLACASKHLAATFNKKNYDLFDNKIYVIVGDGCMQEGVTSEAASLAGHLRLNNLIVLYDDNSITIDGKTSLSFSENVNKRFEAYGWETSTVTDGNNDVNAIEDALNKAQHADRPVLISVKTKIGFGTTKEDTHGVHGSPLGADTLADFKRKSGFDPKEFFVVSEKVKQRYEETIQTRGEKAEKLWNDLLEKYCQEHKNEGILLKRILSGELPKDWQKALPTFNAQTPSDATRNTNGKVLNCIADVIPELIGGCADLSPSTKTEIKKSHDFQYNKYDGRYFRFGVREFGMFAICNGISAYGGGLIPFSSTFLNFITYGWGAVRLGALSHLRQIYIMTHDSVFLGEDGPTHQPIEVLPLLRATPNVYCFRPADGNEIVGTWIIALEKLRQSGIVICLSRQNVTSFDNTSREGVSHGIYHLATFDKESKESEQPIVLIATGSEVGPTFGAAKLLNSKHHLTVHVLSAPCLELFAQQSPEYKHKLLGKGLVVSVEAAATNSWPKYSHYQIGIDRFGTSADLKDIATFFGLTDDLIAERVLKLRALVKDITLPTLPCLMPTLF